MMPSKYMNALKQRSVFLALVGAFGMCGSGLFYTIYRSG